MSWIELKLYCEASGQNADSKLQKLFSTYIHGWWPFLNSSTIQSDLTAKMTTIVFMASNDHNRKTSAQFENQASDVCKA